MAGRLVYEKLIATMPHHPIHDLLSHHGAKVVTCNSFEGRDNDHHGSSYVTDSSNDTCVNASCGKNPCLWYPNAPSRKRTRVVQMDITSIRRFHEQLLMMWKNDGNSNGSSQESEEVLLIDNVNNFIPSNEIGLGCILLKPEDASA
ncbi:hypothetical protein JHK85_021667 [Glycine max]|nr:hypothetical protein JHK85_021667 [Glycine max]